MPSTLGSSFFQKDETYVHLKQKLRLQIWDTAGQEKYRSVNKLFYSEANIIIFVYDITRRETFEEIKNYWVKQVEEFSPENSLKVIVGNKIDLYEFEDIPEEEILEYAKENNFLFYKTSAKRATGVNQLFHQVGKKLLLNLNEEDVDIDNLTESTITKKSKMKDSMLLTSKLSIRTMKQSKRTCC